MHESIRGFGTGVVTRSAPRAALALAIVLVASLLLAVPGGAQQQVPESVSAFFGYDRPAEYGVVSGHVRVPTRDGTELGCTLYRPATGGLAEPGPFPSIVTGFSPYTVWHVQEVESYGAYYARHGYNAVLCAPRGTVTSGGVWPGWFSETEVRDNVDLIEWLAAQPWSTDRVGQEGQSYGGITAYRVAVAAPPALRAIAPQEAFHSAYLDYSYPGGIRSTGDPFWSLAAGPALGGGRPVPAPQATDWLTHPMRDAYWEQIDILGRHDQITAAVLGFGGWVDLFQDGMPRNYEEARDRTNLIMGPWGHNSVFNATVTVGTMLAFFDRHLRQDEHTPAPPDRVASYEMPAGPWREFGDWPPVTAAPATLHLTADGGLSPQPGVAGSVAYQALPNSRDVADPRGTDRVTFTTTALEAPAVLSGAGVLRLRAMLIDPTGMLPADQIDTNLVVEVFDVGPGGQERQITTGYLKASHRSGHDVRERLPEGEPIQLDVPLWNIHWRLEAGDRLRVEVKADGGGCCFSSATQAAPTSADVVAPLEVRIATGPAGSSVDLPILGLADACETVADPREPCRSTAPW